MSDTSAMAWVGRVALVAALGAGISAPFWAAPSGSAPAIPAAAAAASAETGAAAMREQVRQALLADPEMVVDALRAFEAQQREAEEARVAAAIKQNIDRIERDGYSFVGGNPDGDLTIVEFLDYNCGYCKRAHAEVSALIADDGNIRYVVKEFPVLRPPSSQLGARAALAALGQAGGALYKPFHDAMITHEGVLSEEDVFAYAVAVGLDVERLRADLAAQTPKLEQTYALAQALGVNGTPAFVIGGRMVGGYAPKEDLARVVAAARANPIR